MKESSALKALVHWRPRPPFSVDEIIEDLNIEIEAALIDKTGKYCNRFVFDVGESKEIAEAIMLLIIATMPDAKEVTFQLIKLVGKFKPTYLIKGIVTGNKPKDKKVKTQKVPDLK